MGQHNSLMPLYRDMFIASLRDVASASTYPNTELSRDIRTIEHRCETEGLSFLTKTIPSLGKAIDIALSTATPLRCRGFCLKRDTQIPRFLGCLIERVFGVTGDERSDASVEALTWLRQVCALMYKLGVPTTEKQNEDTISSFIATDNTLPQIDDPLPYRRAIESAGTCSSTPEPRINVARYRVLSSADSNQDLVTHWNMWAPKLARGRHQPGDRQIFLGYVSVSAHAESVLQLARQLCCRVVGVHDPRGAYCSPRHGPGAVSHGERGPDKMCFRTLYLGLDRIYPFTEYFCYNVSHVDEVLQELQTYKVRKEGTAKVVLVPKDSRGPRLISMEPKEYQWIQQGVRCVLEKAINDSSLTGGQVNFKDQTINRRLALEGSKDGYWATLDMKDASDRVSVSLVRRLFPDYWFECLFACRSSSTRLPSKQVVPLRKFAPMGSSLCFPVESLVFWCLAVAAIMHKHPTLAASQAAKRVFVYGDDLIVPVEDHDCVLRTLPLYELKFNEKKCCTAGFFRESCGCDAYRGVDVTPLRVKCVWNRRSGKSLVQHVALHNAACERGMFHLADFIYDLVSRVIRFPYSENKDSPYVCWVDPRKTVDQVRQHNARFRRRNGSPRSKNDYQRREILTWSIQARPYEASLPCYSEMLRVASEKRELCSHALVRCAPEDDANLMRLNPREWNIDMFIPESPSVRAYQYTSRREVSLKRRWCPE
jgi:hypothetical protein